MPLEVQSWMGSQRAQVSMVQTVVLRRDVRESIRSKQSRARAIASANQLLNELYTEKVSSFASEYPCRENNTTMVEAPDRRTEEVSKQSTPRSPPMSQREEDRFIDSSTLSPDDLIKHGIVEEEREVALYNAEEDARTPASATSELPSNNCNNINENNGDYAVVSSAAVQHHHAASEATPTHFEEVEHESHDFDEVSHHEEDMEIATVKSISPTYEIIAASNPRTPAEMLPSPAAAEVMAASDVDPQSRVARRQHSMRIVNELRIASSDDDSQ